jgi:tetratricopeptide (TPR) repeat protein
VEDAAAAVRRLLALGLFDDFGEIEGAAHAACNALARPLALPLDPDDRPRMARAALAALAAAWRSDDGSFPVGQQAVAAAEVALEAEAEPEILEEAAFSGAVWLERVQGATRRALALVERVVDSLPPAYTANPGFLRLGVECADALGEVGLLERLLAFPTPASRPDDMDVTRQHAALDLRRAERLAQTGAVAAAEDLTRSALAAFQKAGDERAVAVAAGQIADILQARGDTDEALRIRQEEQLPVFERLGDVRERSVTLQKIAAGLIAAGGLKQGRIQEIYDALAEAFGIAQKLRVPDGIAFIGIQLADILARAGLRDEALGVLDEAEAGFRVLGHAVGVEHVGRMREAIRGNGKDAPKTEQEP